MELGFSNVELEGDLAVLINSLKDDHRSLAQFGHIVADIHYLASHFSFFKLSHVHRHCNKVADSPQGTFDLRSAYKLAMGFDTITTFPTSWIWKAEMLPKIKTFL